MAMASFSTRLHLQTVRFACPQSGNYSRNSGFSVPKWTGRGTVRQSAHSCSRSLSAIALASNILTWQKSQPVVAEGLVLLASFIPTFLAYALSRQLKLGLESELLAAISRATAQLTILGFVLKFVFEVQSSLLSVLVMVTMVLFAGLTAGERAKLLPNSSVVATISLIGGALGTVGLMVLLKVVPSDPRFLIPITGYVVGNAMGIVGWTLNHLLNDIRVHEHQVEAALALGATPYQAVEIYVRRALARAMGPMLDHVKISGVITLPGSITGMLMGGASPIESVQMQLRMIYMLIGAAALSSVIATTLGWQCLFSRSYQLAEIP